MDDLVNNTNKETPVETIKMNPFQRVLGVIISPEQTMQNLAEKPRILFPIIIQALGMLGLYLLRFPLYMDMLRKGMELGLAQSNTQLTPEQIEASLQMGLGITLVAIPLTTLAVWVVVSAVSLGAMKIFKGEGNFKQIASVVGYSYVITLLYLVISAVASFFSGTLMLDASLANLTNLVMPDLKGTLTYGIIRGIDLFTVWYYIVMAIGLTKVGKISKAKAYGVVGVLFIIGLALGATNNMNI